MVEISRTIIERVLQFRWWLAIFALALVSGFLLFFWWLSAEYQPDLVTFSEVTIDDIPIEPGTITLEAGKTYRFSCKAHANKTLFQSIDSNGQPFVDSQNPLNLSPRPDCPKDRFDPVFVVDFLAPWRNARPVFVSQHLAVKTDASGETAYLSRKIGVPPIPGRYELGITWGAQPNGWVKKGPNRWESRQMRANTILWRNPLTVTASRK